MSLSRRHNCLCRRWTEPLTNLIGTLKDAFFHGLSVVIRVQIQNLFLSACSMLACNTVTSWMLLQCCHLDRFTTSNNQISVLNHASLLLELCVLVLDELAALLEGWGGGGGGGAGPLLKSFSVPMQPWLFYAICLGCTVEPLSNDHPHQRPSLLYDHILCDGQCLYDPSPTTIPQTRPTTGSDGIFSLANDHLA